MKLLVLTILFSVMGLNTYSQCYEENGNPLGVRAASELGNAFHMDTMCVGRCIQVWVANPECDFFESVVAFSWIFEGSAGHDSIIGDTVMVCYDDTGTFIKWVFGSSTFSTDSSYGGHYITILPCPPMAGLVADRQTICAGDCVTFTDPLAHVADTWEWHFPGGMPEHFTGRQPPPICYADTGLYDASVTVTSRWGSTTETETGYIQVTAAPARQEVDTVFRIAEGESITLSSPAQGDSYTWQPLLEVLVNNDTTLVLQPSQSRVYTCTVSNTNGCAVKQDYEVRVQGGLLVPSAFTPNNDGQNDRFRVLNTNLTVTSIGIWNRWGEQVYRATDNFGWDGTIKGEPADLGVYVWYLEYYINNTGVSRHATGSITLVR